MSEYVYNAPQGEGCYSLGKRLSNNLKDFCVWLAVGSLVALAFVWIWIDVNKDYDPFILAGMSIGLAVAIAVDENWFNDWFPARAKSPYSVVIVLFVLAGSGLGWLVEAAWNAVSK